MYSAETFRSKKIIEDKGHSWATAGNTGWGVFGLTGAYLESFEVCSHGDHSSRTMFKSISCIWEAVRDGLHSNWR